MSTASSQTLAPGARVRIRDAEWLVQRVDRSSSGGQVLDVVGLSELVKEKEARFIADLEPELEIIDPAETQLVTDDSPSYRQSRLYMESLLRRTAPTDKQLHIGHRAAMDRVPYQLEPALQALDQPRQRILIADSTGLGKTLEAGILMSELIERGRGKRILVVALKSMMTQLQKELWSRFTIPLQRLDSRGIQRIRQHIPANQNPFYYYDKTIISIDTLKRGAEYRAHIENCRWDIVVIDEAQNVADRGTGSQRNHLAELLARRCDTMIMLSATPHDGRPESFASLMTMLDPTAIANPSAYGPEDIKGLYIRRFKKDIQAQVGSSFQERKVTTHTAQASAAEEHAYDVLAGISFEAMDEQGSGGMLFKTTLAKALFSSPMACLETVTNRLARIRDQQGEAIVADRAALRELAEALRPIDASAFSKYTQLRALLSGKDFAWDGSDPQDRLVIFSERIRTLEFLREELQDVLDLSDEAIEVLHGGLSDVDQQRIVEDFGKDEAPIRLLLASDIASEGINLHYLCHRLIHFDIPWSLMVFKQRNGRIDRYGQERQPDIRYLVTMSDQTKIHGDTRILELLIQKDQQAIDNIGDPAALMGLYDIEAEEKRTARAMETGESPEAFEAELTPDADAVVTDLLAMLDGSTGTSATDEILQKTTQPLSLFSDDYTYAREALRHLRAESEKAPTVRPSDDSKMLRIEYTDELKKRFSRLPDEVMPPEGEFVLSADVDRVQDEIKRSRQEQHAWPHVQYLWKLHPLLQWVDDKVVASFERHEAPVLALPSVRENTSIFILSGLIPNLKGQALVHEWFGVRFSDQAYVGITSFDKIAEEFGLTRDSLTNRGMPAPVDELRRLLPEAIRYARAYMKDERVEFEDRVNEPLNAYLKDLEADQRRHEAQIELAFERDGRMPALAEEEKNRKLRKKQRVFNEYLDWIEDTMTSEDRAYIQVVAVLAPDG